MLGDSIMSVQSGCEHRLNEQVLGETDGGGMREMSAQSLVQGVRMIRADLIEYKTTFKSAFPDNFDLPQVTASVYYRLVINWKTGFFLNLWIMDIAYISINVGHKYYYMYVIFEIGGWPQQSAWTDQSFVPNLCSRVLITVFAQVKYLMILLATDFSLCCHLHWSCFSEDLYKRTGGTGISLHLFCPTFSSTVYWKSGNLKPAIVHAHSSLAWHSFFYQGSGWL